jgi:hypothetical protein
MAEKEIKQKHFQEILGRKSFHYSLVSP